MTITPFRYAGGKNKLLPVIMPHLDAILNNQNQFIDVFVGGGSVLLEVAAKYPNIKLYANDKDYWVYCFWKIVVDSDSDKFHALLDLLDNKPNLDLFYKLRAESTTDDIECAYRAIFFNRTTFSGILSSVPIGGKEQKSQYTIDCRYNSKKLKEKIITCSKLLKNRTTVTNLDFTSLDLLINENIPAYLDPPYVEAGKSLYFEYMNDAEHKKLGDILNQRKNWVLSYDDVSLVRNIYQNHKIYDINANYSINGKKINWSKKNELIICPNV